MNARPAGERGITHPGAIAVIASLLAAGAAQGQRSNMRPPRAEQSARLEYRNVPVTAHQIDRDDRRFRLATEGFPLRGGTRLVSRDRELYSIAWINSLSSGMLRDGRAFAIPPLAFRQVGPSQMRVARTIELAGGHIDRLGDVDQPSSHPEIRGYRYATSDNITGTRNYLGLWQRTGGREETLIVSFRPTSSSEPGTHRIVGQLPLRLNSLYVYLALHGVSWNLTLTSQAQVGRPIYILHYSWMPGFYQPLPETDRGAPVAR